MTRTKRRILIEKEELVSRWDRLRHGAGHKNDELFFNHLLTIEEIRQQNQDVISAAIKTEPKDDDDHLSLPSAGDDSEALENNSDTYEKSINKDRNSTRKSLRQTTAIGQTGAANKKIELKSQTISAKKNLTIENPHMAKVQVPDDLVCSICGKVLKDKRGFQFHMVISHSDLKPFECSICKEQFKLAKYLRLHLAKHSGIRAFQCLICSKSFTYKHHLTGHEDMVHNRKKSFDCKVCGKPYRTPQALKDHSRSHSGEFFQCDLCGRSFTSKYRLIEHQASHNGNTYNCDICDKSYTHRSTLCAHKRLKHGKTAVEKRFSCEHCGKKFLKPCDYREHLNMHTGDKPFSCEHCGKQFHASGSLRIHIRIVHKKDRPPSYSARRAPTFAKKFSCEYCGKLYLTPGQLSDHLNTHTGSTPYSCQSCDKKFAKKSSLRVHVRTIHEKTAASNSAVFNCADAEGSNSKIF